MSPLDSKAHAFSTRPHYFPQFMEKYLSRSEGKKPATLTLRLQARLQLDVTVIFYCQSGLEKSSGTQRWVGELYLFANGPQIWPVCLWTCFLFMVKYI